MLQIDTPTTPRGHSQALFQSHGYAARDKALLLRKAASESKGEIEGLQENVSSLQGVIQGHVNAINTYKQQIRKKEDENRSMAIEMKAVRGELEQAKERIKQLEHELHAAEDAKKKARMALSEMEQDTLLRDTRTKDMELRLESLDYELTAANQKINSYESELADLRRRLLTADSQNETLAARADSASLQLVSLQQNLQDLSHQSNITERRHQDNKRAKNELEAVIKRLEAANEHLTERHSKQESIIAELKREVTILPSLKSQLADAQRKLAQAVESKNGASLNLMKSEEALQEALMDSSLAERLRVELDVSTIKNTDLQMKLMEADATKAELEAELMRLRHEVDLAQNAVQLAKEAKRLDAELEGPEEDVESLRASLRESRNECEELAAGVEKLHTMVEKEKEKRVLLEKEVQRRSTYGHHVMPVDVLALAEEKEILSDQLTQVVSSLDMLWNELAPFVFPRAGPTPADGQLAELAIVGSRIFKSSQRTGARLREIVKEYIGVLNSGARRNAEAAMDAETTDDTDDFEVSFQLLCLILEKLLVDITNAKNIIQDQTHLLNRSRHSSPVR